MRGNRTKKPRRIDNRLWKYRKIINYNQKQIAALLGYEKSSQISNWENGRKLPCLKNALKLAHILEIPVELLFSGLSLDLKEELKANGEKLKTSPALDKSKEARIKKG